MKCYMPNLGPHLRHNRHHTLLPMQEQPCIQFVLHLHDQQPTSKYFSKYWLSYDSFIHSLSFMTLKINLFIVFTTGKPLNTWRQKIVIDPCKSLAINLVNLGILLQSMPSRITSRLPVGLHSIFNRSPHICMLTSCWLTSLTFCRFIYHLELPQPLTSTLTSRFTSTFDLLSIYLDFDFQMIHLN
jgi:hypothetical protein